MEMNSEEKVESTQKVLQPNHDPGWNDPPKWAYSPSAASANSPSTKRLLNKRVAFPLSSSSAQTAAPAVQSLPNLPPLPTDLINRTTAPHAPLLAPSMISNPSADECINKEESLKQCLENLKSVINEELQNHCKLSDVEKRLEVMKSMWQEDKFCSQIHKSLLDLSKALVARDIEAAEKIHLFLIMNFPSNCSSWISGIRHLIIELQEKQVKTGETTSESLNTPFGNYNPSESLS